MGENRIFPIFIFVVAFLAGYAFLVGTMPGALIVPPEPLPTQATLQASWDSAELPYYVDTIVITLNDSGKSSFDGQLWWQDVDIGNHDFDIYYSKNTSSHRRLSLFHYFAGAWPFQIDAHTPQWYNTAGTEVSVNIPAADGADRFYLLNTTIDAGYIANTMRYKAQCSHFFVDTFFGFNVTDYSSPSDAWDNEALNIRIAITFDQQASGMNAWSVIGGFMFWQSPGDVHPLINYLFSFPIFVGALFVTVVVILWFLEVLPFT